MKGKKMQAFTPSLRNGVITSFTGCMFAGKSSALFSLHDKALRYGMNTLVVKPGIDNRYSDDHFVTHDGLRVKCITLKSANDVWNYAIGMNELNFVAIDEIQFFDSEIVSVVRELSREGICIAFAGLDLDFRGEIFGSMDQLIAFAHIKHTLCASCAICHEEATRTQRLVDGKPARYDDPVNMVGGSESYQARCNRCHEVPGSPSFYYK